MALFYSYDEDNRSAQIWDRVASDLVATTSFQYDPNSRLTGLVHAQDMTEWANRYLWCIEPDYFSCNR